MQAVKILQRIRQLSDRDKLGLALLVLLWLAAGWWYFVHVPLRDATAAMQAESAQAHAQLVDVENYRQQGQSIEAAEKAQKQRHAFLLKALPSELGQGAFIGGLERLALAKHLRLIGVQPGEALTRPDGLSELPVTVKVSGTYFDLLDFLDAISSAQADGRFVIVRGMTVKAGKDGTALSAVLTLSIFAQGKG